MIDSNNTRFPFSNNLHIDGTKIKPSLVIEKLGPQILPKRYQKLRAIVEKRDFDCAVVLENIYDTGNINAVIRTSENFGYPNINIIESQKTKISQRTTQGAHKWVEIKKHISAEHCLKDLKNKGHQILTTTLSDRSVDFRSIDLTRPIAVVLGNEKDGVSAMAQEMADHHCIIPTVGLSQSFNISVAASIFLAEVFRQRAHITASLTDNEKEILFAHYLIRSYKRVNGREDLLRKILLEN